MWTCKICGQNNEDADKVCGKCGHPETEKTSRETPYCVPYILLYIAGAVSVFVGIGKGLVVGNENYTALILGICVGLLFMALGEIIRLLNKIFFR